MMGVSSFGIVAVAFARAVVFTHADVVIVAIVVLVTQPFGGCAFAFSSTGGHRPSSWTTFTTRPFGGRVDASSCTGGGPLGSCGSCS